MPRALRHTRTSVVSAGESVRGNDGGNSTRAEKANTHLGRAVMPNNSSVREGGPRAVDQEQELTKTDEDEPERRPK